ncbi:MAG TPA: M23 family metallopeptidase [Candidatus Sulfotelmatobacter sp.]|nr:M23 family metallopeptidase [Candidatus Sulfotelmatobacter sp.]
MRSFRIRLAQLGFSIVASVGLAACADPTIDGALKSVVTAMRDANAQTRIDQADHSSASTRPAPAVADSTVHGSNGAPATTIKPVAAAAAVPAHGSAPAAHTTPDLAAMQHQIDDLEHRVADLSAENQRQMQQLSMMTNGAIADMEQLFNSLRLELRSAPGSDPAPAPKRRTPSPSANRALPSGQGGPFLPWPPKSSAALTPSGHVEPLLPDLQSLYLMHQIVMALPLGPPLDEAVVTGPFGHRRDPFNHRSAFHDGIDLQAPMRTPVHAAAAGTVVFAGIRPAYGRVVEIDHGFGIHTRYAHLSAIDVHEGDRIERHAVVGLLGSSGRSASPHLHYEVLFNGRPHDPADLLVLAEGIRSLR